MSRLMTTLTLTLWFIASPALAADGSKPNGKPFVEINGQIAELQGQVATLEQRMSNLLARITLNETMIEGLDGAIILLQEENEVITAWMTDLETQVTTIEQIIAELQAENLLLQSELDELGDATGELALIIEANSMRIDTLSAYTHDGISGLELLLGQNTGAIFEIRSVLSSLEEQLALKQNVLNGKCEDGFEFSSFEDGLLVCNEVVENKGPVEIFQVTVTKQLAHDDTPRGALRQKVGNKWCYTDSCYSQGIPSYELRAHCPQGTSIMGGGPLVVPDYFLEASSRGTNDPDGWRTTVRAKNKLGSGKWGWNPLWYPYLINRYNPQVPEQSLFVSAFALCAKASSNEPLQ